MHGLTEWEPPTDVDSDPMLREGGSRREGILFTLVVLAVLCTVMLTLIVLLASKVY